MSAENGKKIFTKVGSLEQFGLSMFVIVSRGFTYCVSSVRAHKWDTWIDAHQSSSNLNFL